MPFQLHSHLYKAFQYLIRNLRADVSLMVRIYFAAMATIMTVVGAFGFAIYSQKQLGAMTQQVLTSHVAAMKTAYRTKESLVSHNNAILTYLATKDPRRIGESRDLKKTIRTDVNILRTLTNNSVVKSRIAKLEREMNRYFKEEMAAINFAKSNETPKKVNWFKAISWVKNQGEHQKELALMSLEGQRRLDNLFSLCNEIITINQSELERAKSDINNLFKENLRMAIIVVCITGGFILFIAFGLAISLVGSMRGLVEGVQKVKAGNFDIELPVTASGELGRLTNEFNRMAKTIRDQREKLFRQTITDELTGAYNQRYFRSLLMQEFETAKQTGAPLSLLMIDTDHFKTYNDTHGHELGNEVLKRISDTLKDNLRKGDLLVRYGGDEFAVLLPGADIKQAKEVANRLAESIFHSTFPGEERTTQRKITISVGGASYPHDAKSSKDLISKADQALFRAKKAGRNNIQWGQKAFPKSKAA